MDRRWNVGDPAGSDFWLRDNLSNNGLRHCCGTVYYLVRSSAPGAETMLGMEVHTKVHVYDILVSQTPQIVVVLARSGLCQ